MYWDCESECTKEPNAANYDYEEVAEQIFERIKDEPEESLKGFIEEGVFAVEAEFYRLFGEYPEDMDFCSDVFAEVHAKISEKQRSASS